MSSFPPCVLEAETQNRIVIGYAVASDRVRPLLPDGLVPVERAGYAYVSLVGVELINVQLFGVVGLGVQRVPVVELRVHVRRKGTAPDRVGTWTVRAHVPRRRVAWGGRFLYGEPVKVSSMQPVRREQSDSVEVTYRFDWQGREQRIRGRGEEASVTPAPNTLARMLAAPGWRFATTGNGTLLQTQIDRPAAPLHRVQEHHVTVDWKSVYGEVGELLQDQNPTLVLGSPGTPVTLRWRERG